MCPLNVAGAGRGGWIFISFIRSFFGELKIKHSLVQNNEGVPPKLVDWILSPGEVILESGDFSKQLGHERGALTSRMSVLQKKSKLSLSFPPCEGRYKKNIKEPEREIAPDTESWSWIFQPPEL